MLRPTILSGHFHRTFVMNKQEFPAGKLVINFRAGFYPFVIIIQTFKFCCLNIQFSAEARQGIQLLTRTVRDKIRACCKKALNFNATLFRNTKISGNTISPNKDSYFIILHRQTN